MKAIVLAGGRGTRLAALTGASPKPLVQLDGIPILEIILRQLHIFGYRSVTLAVYHLAASIADYFGDGHRFGLRIDYSHTDTLLGTAGPLGMLSAPKEACLILNADLLTTIDFADVMRAHIGNEATATMVVRPYTMSVAFGVVQLNDSGNIVGMKEKPSWPLFINAGVYMLSPAVWTHIPRATFLDMPDLFQKLLNAGHVVRAYVFEGAWADVGTPEQLHAATDSFKLNRGHYLRSAEVQYARIS